MKLIHLLLAAAIAAPTGAVRAQPSADAEPEPGARWSMMLGGGALAPVGAMRDGYQDGLIAGLRIGVRSRLGLGLQLAADYSPLPRRPQTDQSTDTAYGTLALVPAWTLGRGAVRLQLGAGGGLALEHAAVTSDAGTTMTTDVVTTAALAQVGLELHVTRGGGLVLLAGATRTFGARDYQYAWAIGGLALEF